MSNRLDSLNSNKPGSKPALKFKPKSVARKSKEDRDKSAPEIKVEEKPRLHTSNRGRGSTRGRGRGRGAAYVGTHVVSSGPLAMGSVGMGDGHTMSKTGNTADRVYGTNELSSAAALANLKLKSRTGSEDSDDEDPTRFNMNKEYAQDDETSALFPVRPHKDLDSLVEPALALSLTALVQLLREPSRAQTVELVKTESSEEVASVADTINPIEREEHDRIIDDQRSIVDLVTAKLDTMSTADGDNKYIMFHLPQILPQDSESAASQSTLASHSSNFEGEIGSLNFHQSGKITILLNGTATAFECSRGVSSAFLQEVYAIESNDHGDDDAMLDADGVKLSGNIYRLGDVAGKIVATPAI